MNALPVDQTDDAVTPAGSLPLRSRARIFLLSLAVLLLLVGSAYWVASCWQSVFVRWQLDYSESVVLDLAWRIADGLPVYRPIDTPPFVAMPYTPVVIGLDALGVKLAGVAFWPGRLLSTLATLITALLIALIVRNRGGEWLAAALAGLTFLLLPPVAIWAPLYRVDMVAVGFAVGGVHAVLRGRLGWAVALFACSLGSKQSMISAPLAVGAYALLQRDWRTVRFFAVAAASAAAILIALDFAMDHQLYLHHVTYNLQTLFPISLASSAWGLSQHVLGHWRGLPFVFLALLGAWPSRCQRSLPVTLYAAVSLFIAAYTARKVGASINYFVEPCAALSACAGLGVSRLRAGWLATFAAGVAMVYAAVSVFVLPPASMAARGYTTSFTGVVHPQAIVDDASGERLLQEVRATQGDIISLRGDVILLAGKHITFEPFFFSMLAHSGTWDQRHIIERLDKHEIGLVILNFPVELEPGTLSDFFCTPDVRAAIRRNYRLTDRVGWAHIYRPTTE